MRIAAGIIAIFGIFGIYAHGARAATMSVAPVSGSHSVGQTFTVTITANSTQRMNAAEAVVVFDPKLLSVTATSKTGSVFTLWTEEPTHSNSQGTVRFGGGTPAGFGGNSTLLRITFRALAEGTATVGLNNASILAADGRGTNIFEQAVPATYQITAAAPQPPPSPIEAPAPAAALPAAPQLRSETHPDPEKWYNLDKAVFTWTVPSGVTGVRLLYGKNPSAVPTVTHSPPIAARTIERLEEGEFYFIARFGNAAGWGEIARRKILTDLTPPEKFEVRVVSEEGKARPILAFEAKDALSGISHYEISVDGKDPVTVPLERIRDGEYQMDALERGTRNIVVRAVDKAGNKTAAPEITLEVTEVIARTTAPLEDGPSFFEKYGRMIFTTLLLMAIMGLIGYNIMQRQEFIKTRSTAAKEAAEARTTMERVFSALRDEAEDLLAALDGKPGLNEKEKKAFEKLKEAIDISEELISTDIEDVEKLLK